MTLDAVGATRELEVEKPSKESLSYFLDILSAIANIQKSNSEVKVTFSTLATQGYGPKEWIFQIQDANECRYKVFLLGPERRAYIIKNPLYTGVFSNVDEFIKYNMSLIDKMVLRAYTLIREPNSVTINNNIVLEPQKIGFPLDELTGCDIPIEQIHMNVSAFCNTERAHNANFSRISLFEGLNLGEIRDDLIAMHRDVIPNVRELFEEMDEHSLNGRLPEKYPIQINNTVLLGAISNPVNLNLMLTAHYNILPEMFTTSERYSFILPSEGPLCS